MPPDFPPDTSCSTSPFRVGVIDENPVNGAWLADLVGRSGFASRAPSPDLESFDPEHMDIVLVVEDAEGRHLDRLRQIRSTSGKRWTPVLFIASGPNEPGLLAALEAGADDCLAKPFNPAMLRAKLNAFERTLVFQRELDDLRRRSDTIAEHIVDGIVVINEQGIIQSCNRAALDIFGSTRDELLGQNVSCLMPEPYRSEHPGYIQAYMGGRPARIIGVGQRQLLGQRRDGKVFPLELGVSETRIDGRRYFLGILRDVSARVEAEARLRENAHRLQEYHDAQEEENALGRDIIRRQMRLDAIDDPRIHAWLSPATAFSGDMLCVNRGPDGTLYALLADATGHGLTAAITGLPLLTLFHRLARRGEPLARMVSEINNELFATLPTGRFVAATLLRIPAPGENSELWQGGIPPSILLSGDGNILKRFHSRDLPLGVIHFDAAEVRIQSLKIEVRQQLVLFSDGLTDARNRNGEPFGIDRLEAALRQAPAQQRMQSVQQAYFDFMEGSDAEDDISLLLIDCNPQDALAPSGKAQRRGPGACRT